MPLLTSILLLLIGSRLLGELMRRIKQPAIVGEILAGILLGPAVLSLIAPTDELKGISELSVFLIVLSAGLEMQFGEVMGFMRGKGFLVAFLDFFVPLGSGLVLGTLFGLGVMQTVLLGLCMSITALPVAVRILDTFKLLNTKIARYSIATAILNDVAALLFLGVILQMGANAPEANTFLHVALSAIKTAGQLLLFAVIVFAASRFLRWGGSQTKIIEKFLEKIIGLFGKEALFGIAVVFVLLFGSISQGLGSHHVIGAFFGALLLSKDVFGTSLFSELENTIHSLTAGFLAPIFFAFLGLHFSVTVFTSPMLSIAVIAVAMASKILAGWWGARWLRMSQAEAIGVGIMLNGRGIMELVVANIALQNKLIDHELFSSLVLMGVLTTAVTPVLFRLYVLPKLPPQTPEGGVV